MTADTVESSQPSQMFFVFVLPQTQYAHKKHLHTGAAEPAFGAACEAAGRIMAFMPSC